MSKFSIQDLITEVRSIAQKRADVIYTKQDDMETCSYNYGSCSDGTVGCLFGQALQELGFDTSEVDNENIDTVIERLVEKDRDPKTESYPSEQIEWCALVQMNQDHGLSWGVAVYKADKTKV